ncbi:RNA polymerase sigma factor SigJ [Paenibacillus sp. 481]|uniref:RNA polymerase sigma factor SigJ n=1 Tax=Paenibacillus sp. 481 TaxID=2835869 RepID=UPI001E30B855|nr:RNA polymerase sigma factor SigJ [Paenibacillus sp. 481]UHA75466.1 RNA polymerase sigma factor SigJ [Paenibacillus sp. 481]
MEVLYEKYYGLLFHLAYQMTGSAADAEDIVQDVFVRVHGLSIENLAEPKAYLCKMTTNRSLDLLKSARKKREVYTGPWLPEPIPTPTLDTMQSVVHKDLLSYAMLALLERLTPAERAVFVLREALCFEYVDIAEFVGKSEANCRKIFSRARGKMGIAEDEQLLALNSDKEWVNRFLFALEQGNMDTLLSLLSEDAVLLSDGGGKVLAALRPIISRDRVSRFLLGLRRKAAQSGVDSRIELMSLNGQTSFVTYTDGQIVTIGFLHIVNGAIRSIYLMRNPDKLAVVKQHCSCGEWRFS